MIHYHGTPCGGKVASAEEFIERSFVLIPWKRPDDLLRAMELSRGFMVDNSAFSFWTSGEKPRWSDYLKFCRGMCRHPRFHFAIIPDVIDGDEKDNAKLISKWEKDCFYPKKIEGCPVWHLHESMERLDRLCRHWDRVALGSSGNWSTPGTESWFNRMDEAFEVICDDDGYPRAKTHGLRMLRTDIIERYPFHSCDSTNAVQNGTREAAKSHVDSLWGSMTLARRIEQVRSPSMYTKREETLPLFHEF